MQFQVRPACLSASLTGGPWIVALLDARVRGVLRLLLIEFAHAAAAVSGVLVFEGIAVGAQAKSIFSGVWAA